ncbi:hypothetical protein CTZ27_35290 [Streptomyces griseocarneus]|nr:hypothetical protein CTZ27_35290 [Streptomyces griseocarneus]
MPHSVPSPSFLADPQQRAEHAASQQSAPFPLLHLPVPVPDGTPPRPAHTARLMRPGIAVTTMPAAEYLRTFFAGGDIPDEPVEGDEFVREADDLLTRIEASRAGRALIEFFGRCAPLPDPDGSFGRPDQGINIRDYRGTDPVTQQSHPVRVLIGPCGEEAAALRGSLFAKTLPDKKEAASNGYGCVSFVRTPPRTHLLVDDTLLPPELLLAHELIHAAHTNAGALVPNDVHTLSRQLEKQLRLLALKEWETHTGSARKKKETRKERVANDKAINEIYNRYLAKIVNPVPVVDTDPRSGVQWTIGNINREEYLTHGNEVVLEWLNGATAAPPAPRVLNPSPELETALALALEAVNDSAAVRTDPQGRSVSPSKGELDTALDRAAQRSILMGITETVIARELRLRPRIAYDSLTGAVTSVTGAEPRSALGAFPGDDPRSALEILREWFSGRREGAFAAAQIEGHIDQVNNPAQHEPSRVVETRICTQFDSTTQKPLIGSAELKPFTVASLTEKLRDPASDLLNSAKAGKTAANRAPKKSAAQGTSKGGPSSQPSGLVEGKVFGSGPESGRTPEYVFISTVPMGVRGKNQKQIYESLFNLSKKYREGVENARDARHTFALIVGLNCHEEDLPKSLGEAIAEFGKKWEEEKENFMVGVFAFGWQSNPGKAESKYDQSRLPYGRIRQQVLGSEHTAAICEKFTKAIASNGKIYIHTGDADVQSLCPVGKAPLFVAATAALRTQSPIGVLGGSYVAPADDRREIALALHVDMEVRRIMAAVNPRTAYFPEPNTFFCIPEGYRSPQEYNQMLNFGTGSQEGKAARTAYRHYVQQQGIEMREVFDPDVAIATATDRIGQTMPAEPPAWEDPESVFSFVAGRKCKLSQSHATPQTWLDRIQDEYAVFSGQGLSRLAGAFLEYLPDVANLGVQERWVDQQSGRLNLTNDQEGVKAARTALREFNNGFHKVTLKKGEAMRFLGMEFPGVEVKDRQTAARLASIADIITDITRYLHPYIKSITTVHQ